MWNRSFLAKSAGWLLGTNVFISVTPVTTKRALPKLGGKCQGFRIFKQSPQFLWRFHLGGLWPQGIALDVIHQERSHTHEKSSMHAYLFVESNCPSLLALESRSFFFDKIWTLCPVNKSLHSVFASRKTGKMEPQRGKIERCKYELVILPTRVSKTYEGSERKESKG